MRILFMGTAEFAVPSLKALLASEHQVIGVVTQPDRPAGRGRQLRISPVKGVAAEVGLPVYQPERVRSEEFIGLVRELNPDINVVAAFGQIIPKAILDIPKFGNVNVHGSILPKYRGAAPVHYALFNGETVTGVTTMLMNTGLDTGPILQQRGIEIQADDNEATLESRLADVGAELLIETLEAIEKGLVTPMPQDDLLATYSPSVKREECEIAWARSARDIVNRVRGCTPRPGAHTVIQDIPIKVWSCSVADHADSEGSPGDVLMVDSDGIVVRAGDGAVLLTEVQPANRKRMAAGEFARGYQIKKVSS